MGKFIDVAARNASEVEAILGKVRKYVKTVGGRGCNIGELTHGKSVGSVVEYWFQLDNDGKLGDDVLADFVRKSPNAVLVSVREYAGAYMWSTDLYIRPCSIITFKF